MTGRRDQAACWRVRWATAVARLWVPGTRRLGAVIFLVWSSFVSFSRIFGGVNVLKALLLERHIHAYPDFVIEYQRHALALESWRSRTPPTRAQYYRWVGGHVQNLPRGRHCAVLELMFPGRSVTELFGQASTLAKDVVQQVIDIYLRAWMTQDPELIVTIFTPAATYHERVLHEPIRGVNGIREYWQTKVVKEQANIQARLLSLYLDGATVTAEWEAQFDDTVAGHRKLMREVAILEFVGDKIASLREYWASQSVPSS